MEPTITAALMSAAVTLLSVGLAALALGHQIKKDRDERLTASAQRTKEAEAQDALAREAMGARKLADQQRTQAIERAERHRTEDADRRERAKAYSDFLVAESARSDAFDRYATIRNELKLTPFKKDSQEHADRVAEISKRLDQASVAIDRARHEAWAPIAAMRLVAMDSVLRAADEYDKSLAASNPRRTSKTPIHLDFGRKKELIAAFVVAAREDLGRAAVRSDALISVDDSTIESESQDTPAEAAERTVPAPTPEVDLAPKPRYAFE